MSHDWPVVCHECRNLDREVVMTRPVSPDARWTCSECDYECFVLELRADPDLETPHVNA